DGMDCAGCASKIDKAVRRIPGIADVSVSVMAGTMTVLHDGTSDPGAIEKQVTGLGYQLAPFSVAAPLTGHAPDCGHDHHHGDAHDH
ncbi:heavy metal-associated domain-containing protein, partial [Acinetobacter baumannii]